MPLQDSWFWLQPLATFAGTICGGGLVLLGVWVTMRHNWRRLRNEQLERRAKEREQRFQDAYGDFTGAAFRVLQFSADYRGCCQAELSFNPQMITMAGQMPDVIERTIERDKERAWQALQTARTALLSAYARLRLIEHQVTRLELLDDALDTFLGLEPQLAVEQHKLMTTYLRRFCANTGVSIELDYGQAKALADRGQLPPMSDDARLRWEEPLEAEPDPSAPDPNDDTPPGNPSQESQGKQP